MDDKDGVLLVILGMSAAFDTLNHPILLNRLEDSMGVKGAALRWLQSYLTDRHQGVHINDAVSEKVKVRTEVPQGSVPMPLLFLVYLLPLRKLI